jgi:hypothetical protein
MNRLEVRLARLEADAGIVEHDCHPHALVSLSWAMLSRVCELTLDFFILHAFGYGRWHRGRQGSPSRRHSSRQLAQGPPARQPFGRAHVPGVERIHRNRSR